MRLETLIQRDPMTLLASRYPGNEVYIKIAQADRLSPTGRAYAISFRADQVDMGNMLGKDLTMHSLNGACILAF